MGKIIGFAFITLFCALLGLIPEIAMYFIWGMVEPTTEIAKILLVAVFLFGGGSLCVLFGFLAFGLWAHLIVEFL